MKRFITIMLLVLFITPIIVNACSPAVPPFGITVMIKNCDYSKDYDIKVYLKKEELEEYFDIEEDAEEWIEMGEFKPTWVYESDCILTLDEEGRFILYKDFSSFRVEIYESNILISDTVTFSGDLIGNTESTQYIYTVVYDVEENQFSILEDTFESGGCGTGMLFGFGIVLMLFLIIIAPVVVIAFFLLNEEHKLEFRKGNIKVIKPVLLISNGVIALLYASVILNEFWLLSIPLGLFIIKQFIVYKLDASLNRKYIIFTVLATVWPILIRFIVWSYLGY